MTKLDAINRADATVCSRLAEKGLHIDSIYDLVNTNADYTEFVPELMACFDFVTEARILEGLVRSLTIKSKEHDIAGFLAEKFREYANQADINSSVAWAFGNALEVTAKPKHLDQILELVSLDQLGTGRQMPAICLGRIGKKTPEKVFPLLLELVKDDGLVGHALRGLGKLGDPRAIPHIKPILNHPNRWIAKEAEKVIARLQKKLEKQAG